MIRVCDDHGYVDGECPVCGDAGRDVLSQSRRTRLSKFLSGTLRHFPDDVGIDLDERGWADYGAVVAAAVARYPWAEPEHVAAVVATDPKGRFERRDDRIRAAYGHSVDVDLESTATDVPDRLFHGTAPRNLDAIADEGLKPMGRQQVHLSGTRADARDVGARHATDPVVLVVDASALVRNGFDVDRRGTGTYTVERVPPEYVELPDEE